MEPKYFAQVTDGIVTDVRKTTWVFIHDNQNLYPGLWIEVSSTDQYPSIGWLWTASEGFIPPITIEE